jgi:hypothetical protein
MIATEGAEPHESDVASIATKERKGNTPLGCSGRTAEPHECDVASIATKERKGDTPLGCSGRTALRREQCGVIAPCGDLLKFRNLKESDCATVAEGCRALPPLPSPLFASRVAGLRGNCWVAQQ